MKGENAFRYGLIGRIEGECTANSEIEINGGIVVYEFVGPKDAEVVLLTSGGRFSQDFPGVHEVESMVWSAPGLL